MDSKREVVKAVFARPTPTGYGKTVVRVSPNHASIQHTHHAEPPCIVTDALTAERVLQHAASCGTHASQELTGVLIVGGADFTLLFPSGGTFISGEISADITDKVRSFLQGRSNLVSFYVHSEHNARILDVLRSDGYYYLIRTHWYGVNPIEFHTHRSIMRRLLAAGQTSNAGRCHIVHDEAGIIRLKCEDGEWAVFPAYIEEYFPAICRMLSSPH